MVLIFLLLMAVPCAASDKEAALQMTTALENSVIEMQFNYAENLGDGRGITFGCVGFCTGTYDGNILIKHYTELNPNNDLARFIPALDAIDSSSHTATAADRDGNPSVEGLDGFIEAVKGCDDPLFEQAQLDMLDKLYWDPAMKLAEGAGCKNALTKAFIYDMYVRHGPNGAQSIMKEAGSVGDDENAYLERLFQYRDSALKNEGLGDVDRDNGYKQVLEAGNIDLATPFTFEAHGDMFNISGDLGI